MTDFSAIGQGNNKSWGIRIPARHLTGRNTLDVVQLYVREQYAGAYALEIFQGDEPSLGNRLFYNAFTVEDDDQWVDFIIPEGLNLDPTNDLWIGFHYFGDGDYPCVLSVESCGDVNAGKRFSIEDGVTYCLNAFYRIIFSIFYFF